MLLTLAAEPAEAQLCAGRSSFNLASTHFALDAGASRRGRGIGASVGHGTDGLFAIVSGVTHRVAGAGSVNLVTATLATDQPLSPDNKLHLCPIIMVGYLSDRNGATGRRSRIGVAAAGDASMLAVNTPRMRVIPTISIDLLFNGIGRSTALFAQDASRDDHTFSAGLGFVIWNRLSVLPRVVVPIVSVNRSAFQMTVGYNVLRR